MAEEPTLLYKVSEEVPVQSLVCLEQTMKDNTLLTGAEDGTVSEWNMNTMRKTDIIHIGKPNCMGLKTLGNTLFTQDRSGGVKLWEPFKSAWKQIGVIEVDYSGFAKIDVTKNCGGLVACAMKNSAVSIYSVKDCKRVIALQRTPSGIQLRGDVVAVKFVDLAQNSFLLVAYESGDLDLYDLKTANSVSNIKFSNCILSIDFDTDSMLGITGRIGNQVEAFTINDSMGLGITQRLDMASQGVNAVKIIPHKKIVVTGGWDGMVRVYSWKCLTPVCAMMENCTEIRDITFSTNIMVAADTSGKLCFWNM